MSRRASRTIASAVALALGIGAAEGADARSHRTGARNGRAPAAAERGGGAKPPSRAASGPSVQFVTDKRAYLNRGARDGLEPKQSLQLSRGGRGAGSCTIETLADHQATCTGARPRMGDTFRLGARNGGGKREPPMPALPPLTDEATLATRAAAVAEAPYEKVDFSGVAAIGAHARAQLAPGIVVWHTQPDAGGDYTLEQIDGAIQVYDIGGTGLRFDAAFSAMHWGSRAENGRFRPATPTQFYLWEAEVSRRRAASRTVFAVGRIWPWHTPGLTMLDGFQVGRHNEAETIEGGVYAGLVPWALNVAPSSSAWTSGVYGALVQTGGGKRTFRLAREEARIGIASGPDTGLMTEAEALAQVWLGVWNVGAGGRVLRAAALAPQPVLERAHFDLGARATTRFGMGVHVRYFAGHVPVTPLDAVAPARGSVNGMADAHWELAPWLGVAGFAGANWERDTGRGIQYAAAELRLPRLLGDLGGISGGAEVDAGWLRAWILYGQLVGRFGERVQVVARGSVSANEYAPPSPAPNLHEVGTYLHVDGALGRWLRLRAWSLMRVPVLIQGELPTESTFGLAAGLSLTGSY